MPMEQFEDNFENFDIEDFDEDFEEDFEPEVEGEYELTNNEYQDFDDVSQIPVIDFAGDSSSDDDDDDESSKKEESEEEEAD